MQRRTKTRHGTHWREHLTAAEQHRVAQLDDNVECAERLLKGAIAERKLIAVRAQQRIVRLVARRRKDQPTDYPETSAA
jgi:hypothetical protein